MPGAGGCEGQGHDLVCRVPEDLGTGGIHLPFQEALRDLFGDVAAVANEAAVGDRLRDCVLVVRAAGAVPEGEPAGGLGYVRVTGSDADRGA